MDKTTFCTELKKVWVAAYDTGYYAGTLEHGTFTAADRKEYDTLRRTALNERVEAVDALINLVFPTRK